MFGRISTCARGGRGDVHFVLFFARDGGPRRRADVVEAVQKLLAKALFTEMFKKWWVSYESARARGMKF